MMIMMKWPAAQGTSTVPIVDLLIYCTWRVWLRKLFLSDYLVTLYLFLSYLAIICVFSTDF